MSYKERTIWISLGLMLFIWIDYFLQLHNLYQTQSLNITAVNELLGKVVILTIILEIIAQIVLAIIDHKQADVTEDERDKLISLHGSHNAYCILSIGVIAAIVHIVYPSLLSYSSTDTLLPNEYIVMHIIIITAVAAELIKYGTQLFYYRRGFC